MLMIDPPPRSIIPGAVNRTSLIADKTFISTIFKIMSSLTSRAGPCPDVGCTVVDQYIDWTEAFFGFTDQVLELIDAPDVTGDWNRFAGKGLELVGGGFQIFHLAARDDDAGPGFYQPPGDSLADTSASAGDQRDLTLSGSTNCSLKRLQETE